MWIYFFPKEKGIRIMYLPPSPTPAPPVYSWYKYPNSSDECVIDDRCTRDESGKPVPFCSQPANAKSAFCRQDQVKQQTLSNFIGCYDDPECGKNVPAPPIMVGARSEVFKPTPPPSCPISRQMTCSLDQTTEHLMENCVELRDGVMTASDLDKDGRPKYCFLGNMENPFTSESESSSTYDPCKLSYLNGGVDLCPKSCFNAGCCPGSFGHTRQ